MIVLCQFIVCDFEQSVRKSVAVIVPTVSRRAAISINYRKALVSRLGDLGLKAFYNGDIEFNK